MDEFERKQEPTLRPLELLVCLGVVELGEKSDARSIAEWLAKELENHRNYRDDAASVRDLFRALDHLEALGVLESYQPKGADATARTIYGVSQWGLRIAEKQPEIRARLTRARAGHTLH